MGVELLKALSIILGGTVMGFLGFILYNIYKEKDEPENQLIIENFHLSQSDGHSDGIVNDLKIGENRIMIEWYPRDINYIKEMKNNKNFRINPIKTYYDKNQVEVLSLGTGSMHRSKIKAYPSRVSDLNSSFKKTEYGEAIMGIISKNNERVDEVGFLESRLKQLKEVAKKTLGGEIFTDYISKTKEIIKDLEINKKDDFRQPEILKK